MTRPAVRLDDVEPVEVASPPAALLSAVTSIGLDGCRCPWQLRPRSGWVRLFTTRNCPHHDREWQQKHLDEALRKLVPRDWHPAGEGEAAAVVGQIRRLLWGGS